MRYRVLAAVAALLLVAAACETSIYSGRHWRRNPGQTVIPVTVAIDPAHAGNSTFVAAIDAAVGQANLIPRVRLSRTVGACPAGANCISITRAPRNGAATGRGADANGHMYGHAVRITFDSAPWNKAVLFNAACHELAGHALGLSHGEFPGPCADGKLTDHDRRLLTAAYAHND